MADKNQLKIADPIDFSEDDPFAELTRIMGFDPREPARKPVPVESMPVEPESVEEAASDEHVAFEDDFSMDLEKELLGGFDFDDEPAFSAVEPAHAPEAMAPQLSDTASSDMAASGMADVDFDFSGAFDSAEPEHAGSATPEVDFGAGFEQAFAPASPTADDHSDDFDFDFGQIGDDVGNEPSLQHAAPAPLPVTPEAVAEHRDVDLDTDFDTAMADIDMDFLSDTETSAATAQSAALPLPVEPSQVAEAADAVTDFDFFDDFHIEDDRTAAKSSEPTLPSAPEPRVEAIAPGVVTEVSHEEVDPFSFDDLDFGAVENVASEEGTHEPQPVAETRSVVEPQAAPQPAPLSAENFQLSVPAYVPRKLPVSPMDVAAEEFRTREAAAAPAETDFNLQDELNALLGNVRQIAARSDAAAAQPTAVSPPAPAVPLHHDQPVMPAASFEPENRASAEPVGYDAPAHPAAIDDDLQWDLDAAFADEAPEEEPEQEYEPQTGARHESYAVDEYAADDYAAGDPSYSAQPYAESYRDDDGLNQSGAQDEPVAGQGDTYEDDARDGRGAYDAAFGSAAIAGAASAGYASSYAAAPRQAAAPSHQDDRYSPHRDPVVRGNPLKEDPLDVITQLAAKYSRQEPITAYGRTVDAARTGAAAQGQADDDFDFELPDDMALHPELETVEVHDQAVALADDLDIPDLPEVEEYAAAPAYDDLDAEFSSLLTEMNDEPHQASQGYGDPLAGGFSTRPFENRAAADRLPSGSGAARQAPDQPDYPGHGSDFLPDSFSFDADDLPGSRASGYPDQYDFDPDMDQEIAPAHHMAAEQRRPGMSRGLLLAGIVGGVALIGAIGAYALSSGNGSGGDAPALVRADDGPVKVKPENPGGTTVPNQDNKVYDAVSREATSSEPQQDKLVTTAEEPLDVAPVEDAEDEATAFGKGEDRIEQILDDVEGKTDSEIIAVAPRKVRTMVVKPDGTLVPREDDPEMAPSNEQTDTIAAASPRSAEADEEVASLPEEIEPAPSQDRTGSTPPAPDQQVAAATTAAAAGGGWAMQIASQPNEAAAQSSYKDLARRYASVLQGHEVNIVKAEIDGKGTFWRVRVPANSRAEAVSLCESYKAAGGSCFVSR